MGIKVAIKDGVRNVLPRPALLALKRLTQLGAEQACVVCGARVRAFLDQGYTYPVLEELRVVGGMHKANDECPICHANDRVRLIHLYTRRHSDLMQKPNRLLHVAPELGLADLWSKCPTLDYVPADMDRLRYKHLNGLETLDIQDTQLPDQSFDWIIANHVLEHVTDDRKAMGEIYRILKVGGTALLQVPIALGRDKTDEDTSVSSESERIRRFGQRDHVRLYASDYYDRLRDTGFKVELWDAFRVDRLRATAWKLNPLEKLTIARRVD
jgi:SAM-dependent methyltransferase